MLVIQGTEQSALEAGYGAQQNGQPLYVNSHSWKRMTEKFLKGEPKILGIVQIVIAIMNLSIGIMMIIATVSTGEIPPSSVYIGYPIWGSLMGLDIVVVVLSVLEFCIGVSLSAFGCRVMCCNPGGVMIIMPSNPTKAETANPVTLQSGLMPPEHQERNVPENMH
ncbi:membrane-spanning 4-domains subfamily A member 4A isoform X1 [Mus musculus]|uniref:membrane-spanning 4-domains subfamily A member 4A isoform X1 n=1 Tax=Mus musculus TaxID=10090 RepID=UPI0016740C89|nr:membrane-spanning 4-domains subfamily A member 4A isoform X1 [Mus musculus]